MLLKAAFISFFNTSLPYCFKHFWFSECTHLKVIRQKSCILIALYGPYACIKNKSQNQDIYRPFKVVDTQLFRVVTNHFRLCLGT